MGGQTVGIVSQTTSPALSHLQLSPHKSVLPYGQLRAPDSHAHAPQQPPWLIGMLESHSSPSLKSR